METGKKVDEKYFKYLEYGLCILAAAAAYLVFMHPDLRNTASRHRRTIRQGPD